jgi:sugar lactone lactonase YvrE
VAFDASGNLYIADTGNNVIRKVGPSGGITTVAGNATAGFSGDGGPAVSAQLSRPFSVAVDASGYLYIADNNNYVIRKVGASGVITTIAGNGKTFGSIGDGTPATAFVLPSPNGLAIDAAGNLYIADYLLGRVRQLAPSGVISTVAGNGGPGSDGDGTPAKPAQLRNPVGVAVDAAGNLYIADYLNNNIREVVPRPKKRAGQVVSQ